MAPSSYLMVLEIILVVRLLNCLLLDGGMLLRVGILGNVCFSGFNIYTSQFLSNASASALLLPYIIGYLAT